MKNCDCLNICGDDPRVLTGDVAPCGKYRVKIAEDVCKDMTVKVSGGMLMQWRTDDNGVGRWHNIAEIQQ